MSRSVSDLAWELRDHPEVIAVAVFTYDDLDGRQTESQFSGGALEDHLVEVGMRYLWENSRPGCECASHDDDDQCEVIA